MTIQDVTQSLAESFGLKRPEGALVSFVDPESPAAKAGIEVGDVITKLDGQDVVHSKDLPVRIAESKPGSKVTMEVWRKGSKHELTATIGSFKSEKVASNDSAPASQGRLGLAVRPAHAAGARGGRRGERPARRRLERPRRRCGH